jgi:hypothetical protein
LSLPFPEQRTVCVDTRDYLRYHPMRQLCSVFYLSYTTLRCTRAKEG